MNKLLRGSIFLFFIFLHAAAFSQAARAYASLDSNEVTIGDKVKLHLSIEWEDNSKLNSIAPDMPLDTTKFELISDTKWLNKTNSGMQGRSRDLVFQAFDTGLFTIKPVVFTVITQQGEGEVLQTPSLLLTVNYPRGTESMVAPIDIKPIERTAWTFKDDFIPFLMYFLPYLILLCAVGFLIWRYLKTRKAREIPPLIQQITQPPHVIAERLLAELKAKQMWQKGHVKEYYSELSRILRGYLEDAFKMPALENTTDELIELLKKREFHADLIEKTQNLLQTADLVKFAKVEPPTELHDKYWTDVATIVERTKPKPIEIVDDVK